MNPIHILVISIVAAIVIIYISILIISFVRGGGDQKAGAGGGKTSDGENTDYITKVLQSDPAIRARIVGQLLDTNSQNLKVASKVMNEVVPRVFSCRNTNQLNTIEVIPKEYNVVVLCELSKTYDGAWKEIENRLGNACVANYVAIFSYSPFEYMMDGAHTARCPPDRLEKRELLDDLVGFYRTGLKNFNNISKDELETQTMPKNWRRRLEFKDFPKVEENDISNDADFPKIEENNISNDADFSIDYDHRKSISISATISVNSETEYENVTYTKLWLQMFFKFLTSSLDILKNGIEKTFSITFKYKDGKGEKNFEITKENFNNNSFEQIPETFNNLKIYLMELNKSYLDEYVRATYDPNYEPSADLFGPTWKRTQV